MSVRKRVWKTVAGERMAWIADYAVNGKRRLKTFATKREAEDWAARVKVVGSDGSPAFGRQHPAAEISGVYVLYLRGLPVYIGQSANVFDRLGKHKRDGRLDFDAYGFQPVDGGASERLAVERKAIRALMPNLNRKLPKDAA